MKFYAGPTFLFSNMMICHTFDVDIIMNALLTNSNMDTLINHVSNRSKFIENAYAMKKFYAEQKFKWFSISSTTSCSNCWHNHVSTCALGYIQL